MTEIYVDQQTTRVEVMIYPNHALELQRENTRYVVPKLTEHKKRTPISFRTTQKGAGSEIGQVVGVTTNKQLGAAAGQFEVRIKSGADLRYVIQDGDWIDIVFKKTHTPYHVMRGIVSTVSQTMDASGGATATTYLIVGSDFGGIFEKQSFWYDSVTEGDNFPYASSRIWSTVDAFGNNAPNLTVAMLLKSFLIPNYNDGAALWLLPSAMPIFGTPQTAGEVNRYAERDDITNVVFSDAYMFVDGYSHVPPRTSAIIPAEFHANASSVWELATEFSDSMICELFVDLRTRTGGPITGPSLPTNTNMAVIFRDSPFPNTVRDANLLNAPYFKLPTASIDQRGIAASTLARHGELRKNMFFFSPLLRDDDLGDFITYQTPQVDIESVRHHGVRRMDARSRYMTDPAYVEEVAGPDEDAQADVYLKMALAYRNIVRDLHCMNHLLLNGTINLNHSRPDIRIGSRVRVHQHGEATPEMIAYVEGVQHTWSYGTGARTALTVSHGWQGTDRDYIDAFLSTVARYGVFTPKRIEGERDWDTSRETPLESRSSDFWGRSRVYEGSGGQNRPLTPQEKQEYIEDYGAEFFIELGKFRQKEKEADPALESRDSSQLASSPDDADLGGMNFTSVAEVCVEQLVSQSTTILQSLPPEEQAKLRRWSSSDD